MKLYWEKFESMGTEIVVSAFLKESEKNILATAKKAVCDFSDNFSRFLTDNELSFVNNARGEKTKVSLMMAEILQLMKEFNQKTEGIFDPTIIGALESVGYDKDFDLIKKGGNLKRGVESNGTNKKYFKRVLLNSLNINKNFIQAPKGFRVDTGGIGKGYIIDYVAKIFLNKVENYWISAGGDLLVNGGKENYLGWEVEVQDPLSPDKSIFVLKTSGEKIGIATSGIIKRRGEKNGIVWHHIIDPRSGLPVKNDILSVTVIASDAKQADVFAKTVLILGREEGVAFIENQPGAECIIFSNDKKPLFSQRMHKYLK